MNDNQSQELLPCPFCGDVPTATGFISHKRGCYFYCDLSNLGVIELLDRTQWNTRHTPKPPADSGMKSAEDTKRMDFLENGSCEGDIIDPESGRITRRLIDLAISGIECPTSTSGKHKYYRDLDRVQNKMVESDTCAICGHKRKHAFAAEVRSTKEKGE